MLVTAIFWGLTLFSLGGCLFALAKGGVGERLAAAVIIFNIVLGYGVVALFPSAVENFRLVNDGLAALALLLLAVRYAAPWLGGAMFFYAAQFALHSYFIVLGLPSMTPLHANLNNLNFVGIIWCLVIGTAVAWSRRRRLARDAAAQASAA